MYVKTPRYVLKSALPVAKTLVSVLAKQLNIENAPEAPTNQLPPMKKTSLTSANASRRRWVSYVELPIGDALAIRKHFECSINDLALVLDSAALEHYFEKLARRWTSISSRVCP